MTSEYRDEQDEAADRAVSARLAKLRQRRSIPGR